MRPVGTFLTLLALCAGTALRAGPASPRQSAPLVLDGVRIVDGQGGEPIEQGRIVIDGERIAAVGAAAAVPVPPGAAELELPGHTVIPGLIDPHEHLSGAAGEQGFGSRMPEVAFEQLLRAGITTVVGCLGTDTTTRSLPALLGKVRELEAQGLTGFLYTGGFPVPTPTITSSISDRVPSAPARPALAAPATSE